MERYKGLECEEQPCNFPLCGCKKARELPSDRYGDSRINTTHTYGEEEEKKKIR